ncbi:MAG: vWA domain-containing protein [Gemmataceae bacterium]
MAELISFGTDDFALNPEPRLPCVLLLDTSGSMEGAPIDQLNAGLDAYRDALAYDDLAARRVEIAVVTFGGTAALFQDFSAVGRFYPPRLTAGGETPMGQAVLLGLDHLRKRKDEYRSNGVAYFRPWVFLITDGVPTDDWKAAAEQVKAGEGANAFSFFAVGVETADFAVLRQMTTREPLKLRGLSFRELFLWLSASQVSVSRSSPGDKVMLPPPTGWASV